MSKRFGRNRRRRMREEAQQLMTLVLQWKANAENMKGIAKEEYAKYREAANERDALRQGIATAYSSGVSACLVIAKDIYTEAERVAHPDAEGWTKECVNRIEQLNQKEP